jgi:GTP-binding protein
LRHIERCKIIVHVIDCATYEPGRDPASDLAVIESELAAYGGLEDRPRMVALNKVDVEDAAEIAEIATPEIEAMGYPVFRISTKTGEGLQKLSFAMANLVAERRASAPEPEAPRIVLRPKPVDEGPQFQISKMSDQMGGFVWRVKGAKTDRWVKQTDFNNDEAVGYLADRLNRLGVEDELLKLGAEPGDAVAIGADPDPVVFDFAPQIDIDTELLSRRGEDNRLEEVRPAVRRRREADAAYHAARDAIMENQGRDADWRHVHGQSVHDFEDWDEE